MKYLEVYLAAVALAGLWSFFRPSGFALPGLVAFTFTVLLAIGVVTLACWVWMRAVARGRKKLGGEPALGDVNILVWAGIIIYSLIILALVLAIGLALVLHTWLPPLVFSAALTVWHAVLAFLFVVISFAESQPNFPRTGDFPPSTFGFFLFILNPIGLVVTLVMSLIWDRIMEACRWRLPDAMSGDLGFLAGFGIVGTAIWFGEMYGLALLLNWINS